MNYVMKYAFKLLFLLYMVIRLSLGNSVTYNYIAVVLIFTATNIFRERYFNLTIITVFEFLLVTYASGTNLYFTVLYGIIAYDVIARKQYAGVTFVLAAGGYYLHSTFLYEFILFIGVCSAFSYISSRLNEKDSEYKRSYDKERRYRYELEEAKNKLLNSSREISHLAQVNERNRIAREIHDNVGHGIAGVLLQLQASNKLYTKDQDRSKALLEKSIDELSKSLAMLRDTVHNIKPRESLGIEYIKNIIDNFRFCPVNFRYSGDLSKIDPNHLEIIATNIKEALTNASKYSNASEVNISIDITDRFARLYIKDNGTGCSRIKENLGISGMKERIKNIGGSISISGEDGFLIVCILPVNIDEVVE